MMRLSLHSPDTKNHLAEHYGRAFSKAVELFIVTAYLTEWDESLVLNKDCKRFRIIAGKDFGITRKHACESVMRWLPPEKKGYFLIADFIDGFHPKAVFWKQDDGACYAIVGSSNLTKAAFESNYEANVISRLSEKAYGDAKKWVRKIEKRSVVVSQDWLSAYQEAVPAKKAKKSKAAIVSGSISDLWLPMPKDSLVRVRRRRAQIRAYGKKRQGLINLFSKCASGKISPDQFYERLPNYWSAENDDRIQGSGWQILGKSADFALISKSYMQVLRASEEDRDDVVSEEIDFLASEGVSARSAFFTEMLCLEFPHLYPVLNKPIKNYLKAIKFKAPRKASEGARYIDLSKKLRLSLIQNPKHPAKNLAALDAVIESQFRSKN